MRTCTRIDPLFSIIIPTYNRANFLTNTINSVLEQNCDNWECIIVDDGSTDNTREIVALFKDQRIQYFYKENEERSIARNFGIQRSNGHYICFLDSDDEYYPNHLSVLSREIGENNFPKAMFYTGIIENRNGKISERGYFDITKFKHPVFYIWKKFILINSVCVHREILLKHQFPKKFNVWEDTHLWLRIVLQYPFFEIKENTTKWNIHDQASVSQAFRKVTIQHVKNYLNCVSHLFQRHGDLLKPFLTEKDKKEYQLEKLKMFLNITFNTAEYKTFLELYFIGLRYVDKKALSKLVFEKVFNRLRKRITKA